MNDDTVKVRALRPFSHNTYNAVGRGARVDMDAKTAAELEKAGFVALEAAAPPAPAEKQAAEPLNKMKPAPANKRGRAAK